jgi:hypothetical protein
MRVTALATASRLCVLVTPVLATAVVDARTEFADAVADAADSSVLSKLVV